MKEFKEKRAIERYNKNLSRSPKSKESSPKNRQQISSTGKMNIRNSKNQMRKRYG
jgi:hypothetical protein